MSTSDVLTKYAEGKILDDIFRNVPWALPANLYFCLLTGVTDPELGNVTEVGAGEYARVAVVRSGTQFTNTATTITNDNDIVFPQPTTNWGTATHWAIADASTAGNYLIIGALDDSKAITDTSQQPKWGAGQFKVQFNLTTTLLANKIANWVFLNSALGLASNLDLGLFTVLPTGPDDAGTEVTGNGYNRSTTVRSTGNFDDPVLTGETENSNEIAFPTPTPVGWGDVVGMGVYEGANLLIFDGFPTIVVNANDAPKFAAGAFSYSVD